MLNLSILAGGRAKSAPEHSMAMDYLTRARDQGRTLGFHSFKLTEIDDRTPEKMKAALAAISYPILLDERGKSMDSVAFANWLATLRDQGLAEVTFCIGGADGHSANARKLAKASVAFGAQTWPHLLVRTMLCEQIFRAMTILSGHPYHRAG